MCISQLIIYPSHLIFFYVIVVSLKIEAENEVRARQSFCTLARNICYMYRELAAVIQVYCNTQTLFY